MVSISSVSPRRSPSSSVGARRTESLRLAPSAVQPKGIPTLSVSTDHFHPSLARSVGFLPVPDRKSTRLNSSHLVISYAVFCLKKKKINEEDPADSTVASSAATARGILLWRSSRHPVCAIACSLLLQCFTAGFTFFFFNDTATTEIYTLSLHDALPIYGVVVAHHVVAEDHEALLRQIDTARRYRRVDRMLQPPVIPVAVRGDDAREAAGGRRLHRAIEVAAEIVARHGLQQYLLDGVGPVFDAPEDLRMQGVLRRHGQEAGGRENLFAQACAPRLPLRQRLVGARGEVGVGVRDFGVARVLQGDLRMERARDQES